MTRKNSLRLAVEALESRWMPTTGLSVNLTNSILSIIGSKQADTITVRQMNNRISVDGVSIKSGQTMVSSIANSQIKQIFIDGKEGDDLIVLGGANSQAIRVPGKLLGGLGNDRIFGGMGADTLDGGAGNDLLCGLDGIDQLFGQAGDDTLFGGAGKDQLNGGPGKNQVSDGDYAEGKPDVTVLAAPRARNSVIPSATLLDSVDAIKQSLNINGGTGFPIQGPFLIRVDEELMTVTSVRIGVWTVERGTSGTRPQPHKAGAVITLVEQGWPGESGGQGGTGEQPGLGEQPGSGGQGDQRNKPVPPAIISPIATAGSITPTFVWTPVRFAKRYEIFVADPTASKVLNPTDISGNVTTWVASTALVPGTTYKWMVRAIVDDGYPDPWSEPKSFQVTGSSAGTAPFAPTSLSYQQFNKSDLTLSWSNVGGEAGYAVDYWTGTDWKEFTRTGTDVTTVTITGGIGYYFRVGAFNAAGTNYSKYLFAADGGDGRMGGTTGGATGVTSAPTGLIWSPTDSTSGILNWSNVDAETGYVIEYWNGTTWARLANTAADITTLAVTNGAGNYLRVGAIAPGNRVLYSNHILAPRGGVGSTGASTTAPAAPAGLRWSPLDGKNGTLFWSNVSGETGYVVEYWNGTTWSRFATTGTDINSLYVTEGAGRYLRVGAFNAVGTTYSGYLLTDAGTSGSTGGGSTGSDRAPSAPSQLRWSPSTGNDGNLSWTNAAGENSYVIEYWNGTNWIQFASTSADITTLYVTSGANQYLRVGARNSFGTTYSDYLLAG